MLSLISQLSVHGRISDLRIAAQVLKGKHVKKGLRCIVIPATQSVYLQAIKEGLITTFVEAGCVVSAPTCGPCLGGHMGILAKGERAISTTNRNFVGRMGHPESEVYLASPAVAAVFMNTFFALAFSTHKTACISKRPVRRPPGR